MPWLDVPFIPQTEDSWCVPACVAMVAAFNGESLAQEDVARWLGTTEIGTPHAVVLVGFEDNKAFVLDPAHHQFPVEVALGELMLAWSELGYTFAVMR